MLSYEEFVSKLNKKIASDADLYYDLLVSVVKNPNRYTGIFRLSNAKTKLIQNVTQSREIKFGDFMEDIITDYVALMGYKNLNKRIGTDPKGNTLSVDQVFQKGDTVYLIEQKIRDDHDSTKKRGQYDNFKKKYSLLHGKFSECQIDATMWFIDNSLVKNKSYYLSETKIKTLPNVTLRILYGGELFSELFNRSDVWDEICGHLARNKYERTDEILTIPDFDTSEEIKVALTRLKAQEPRLFKKLISDREDYAQLRAELFPTGSNLKNC